MQLVEKIPRDFRRILEPWADASTEQLFKIIDYIQKGGRIFLKIRLNPKKSNIYKKLRKKWTVLQRANQLYLTQQDRARPRPAEICAFEFFKEVAP